MAAVPIPLEPPCTSNDSPACKRPRSNTLVQTVKKVSGIPAASAAVIPVGRKFKTVVTSSAGHPLDKTYYQTIKGMVTPLDILEPGGTLIMASTCSEGFGSDDFRAAQDKLVAMGSSAFLEMLNAKTFADIDEWQTERQLKPMRIGRVCLYTDGLNSGAGVW